MLNEWTADELLTVLFETKATGDRHKVIIERYAGGFRAKLGGHVGEEADSPTGALDNLRLHIAADLDHRVAISEQRLAERREAMQKLRAHKEALS